MTHQGVVPLDEFGGAEIAEVRLQLRRSHEVAEEYRQNLRLMGEAELLEFCPCIFSKNNQTFG